MARQRRMNDDEALAAINQVWTEQGRIPAAELRQRVEASGDNRPIQNLISLKNSGHLIGRVEFNAETGELTHYYERGI